MTPIDEYIKAKCEKSHWDFNPCDYAFTAGASMMVEHLPLFTRWVNEWYYYTKKGKYKHKGMFNDRPKPSDLYSLEELLQVYIKQL